LYTLIEGRLYRDLRNSAKKIFERETI